MSLAFLLLCSCGPGGMRFEAFYRACGNAVRQVYPDAPQDALSLTDWDVIAIRSTMIHAAKVTIYADGKRPTYRGRCEVDSHQHMTFIAAR